MENDIQIVSIKNGWAAVGKDWAVFGQTREQAVDEFRRAEIKHQEILKRIAGDSTSAILPPQGSPIRMVGVTRSDKGTEPINAPQRQDLLLPSFDAHTELETNHIYCGDCVDLMKRIASNSIDLVVTSPPYDTLRTYNGFSFTFEKIAAELLRVLNEQGIIVWVVGDKIENGNKSLTSFRQAIYFQEHGFKIHDIMIYEKKNTPFMRSNAYTNCYELMIVLSKKGLKTFNPLMVGTKREGYEMLISNKKADGINKKVLGKLNETKVRNNIWQYAVGLGGTTKDKIAFTHPAVFPEQLAEDQILSWTNEGDIVLDPMCGSGTTCKMAMVNNRRYIGIDISEEYCEIARRRLSTASRRMAKLP